MLISAGPGTGKSALALTIALRAKVPTLYLSADSDAFIQRTRALAILNDIPVTEAAQAELHDTFGDLEQEMAGIPLRFSYDSSPSLDTIGMELDSYYEVFAEYPHLIIVDNITNVRTGSAENEDNPFAGMEGLMDCLHSLARDTGACILALHHVNAEYNNGDKPIAMNGVKGQITRVPPAVLTLFRHDSGPFGGALCVSIVKNRGGKQDPTGRTYAELAFDGDKMRITDPHEAA